MISRWKLEYQKDPDSAFSGNGNMGIFDYRRKKVKQGRHAWQHIDFLGQFEFQKQQNQFNNNEIISALEQKTAWQQLKTTDETLDQKPYFTFLRG